MNNKQWEKPDFEVLNFCETKGSGKNLFREREDYNVEFDEEGNPISIEPNFDEGGQGPS